MMTHVDSLIANVRAESKQRRKDLESLLDEPNDG